MKIIVEDSDLYGLVKIIKLYQNGFPPLWRYTLTHFLRKIHDKQYFKVTPLVKKTIGIEPNVEYSDTTSLVLSNKFIKFSIIYLLVSSSILYKVLLLIALIKL